MMLFPITQLLHPNGLKCPECHASLDTVKVHRKDRTPLLYYRCSCNRVFNAFAGTIWQGTHHLCCNRSFKATLWPGLLGKNIIQ